MIWGIETGLARGIPVDGSTCPEVD